MEYQLDMNGPSLTRLCRALFLYNLHNNTPSQPPWPICYTGGWKRGRFFLPVRDSFSYSSSAILSLLRGAGAKLHELMTETHAFPFFKARN